MINKGKRALKSVLFLVPLTGLEPVRTLVRGILSNYRNGVVKSFAEKIRENRGETGFYGIKSVDVWCLTVTIGVVKCIAVLKKCEN